MTPERLAEIRERCERATDGPWGRYGWPDENGVIRPMQGALESAPGLSIGSVGHTEPIARLSGYLHPVEANADFVAHARQDVPDLLADNAALREREQALRAALVSADSLLDCTDFALEWFFEKFDDPKFFKCDCSEDGGYMEWDTNAYIHTERCSSGRDDSLGALKDQIGQWRQQARAALAADQQGVK